MEFRLCRPNTRQAGAGSHQCVDVVDSLFCIHKDPLKCQVFEVSAFDCDILFLKETRYPRYMESLQ